MCLQKSGVQGPWLRTWLDVGNTDTRQQLRKMEKACRQNETKEVMEIKIQNEE